MKDCLQPWNFFERHFRSRFDEEKQVLMDNKLLCCMKCEVLVLIGYRWLKLSKTSHFALAVYLDNRYLGASDAEFVTFITADIASFLQTATLDRVLLFPPVTSYHRLLIHKTVEEFSGLASFSVGEGRDRRTVICLALSLFRGELGQELMSKPPDQHVRRGRGRGRGRGTSRGSPSPSGIPPGNTVPSEQGSGLITADTSVPSKERRTSHGRDRKKPEVQIYVPRARRQQNAQDQGDHKTNVEDQHTGSAGENAPSPGEQRKTKSGRRARPEMQRCVPRGRRQHMQERTSDRTNVVERSGDMSPVPDRSSDMSPVPDRSSERSPVPDSWDDMMEDAPHKPAGVCTDSPKASSVKKFKSECEYEDNVSRLSEERTCGTELRTNVMEERFDDSSGIVNRESVDSVSSGVASNDRNSISAFSEALRANVPHDSPLCTSQAHHGDLSDNHYPESLLAKQTDSFKKSDSLQTDLNLPVSSVSMDGKSQRLDSEQSEVNKCPNKVNSVQIQLSNSTNNSHSCSNSTAPVKECCSDLSPSESQLPAQLASVANPQVDQVEYQPMSVESGVEEPIAASQEPSCVIEEDNISQSVPGGVDSCDSRPSDQSSQYPDLEMCLTRSSLPDIHAETDQVMKECGLETRIPDSHDKNDRCSDKNMEEDNNVHSSDTEEDKNHKCSDNMEEDDYQANGALEQNSFKGTDSEQIPKQKEENFEMKTPAVLISVDQEIKKETTADDEDDRRDTTEADEDKRQKTEADEDDRRDTTEGVTLETREADVNQKMLTEEEEESLQLEKMLKAQAIAALDFAPPATSASASASQEEEEEEDSWDKIFDDNGDCLDPSLVEELTAHVGKVQIDKPKIDYLNFQPKERDMDMEMYNHIIEIYDFPSEFLTRDLITAFRDFMSRGFDIKWVDDTHALGVFASSIAAQDALRLNNPLLKVRSLSEASHQSKTKAKKNQEFLQPFKARPQTSASAARRLVSGALGLQAQIPREKREMERKQLKEAKEKRRKDRKLKQDMWDGSIGRCAMDKEG